MKCYLCQQTITPQQQLEKHHRIYKSRGGHKTAPAHKACHRSFHSGRGDFKSWGRIGGQLTAMTRRWAFNLKHVKDSPQFATERGFYLTLYTKGGAS